MDALASEGIVGEFTPIPDGFPPGSDVGNLSLFGYDPAEAYTGRAPLEAANQGLQLGPNQIAFRCNMVTLNDGTMASFTADHISSEESSQLIDTLNDSLGSDSISFHSGVGYRHLCIITCDGALRENLSDLTCTPPHDISDQAIASHLPTGQDADYVRAIMKQSQALLPDHHVNKARTEAGKPPANSVWLWGQGQAPVMESYGDMLGRTGAVISAVDLVMGIGVCAGLRIINVPGATGYLDTDYAGKVAAAKEALADCDMVYLHVEAPDETSHEGRTDLKIQAIQDFDSKVVVPMMEFGRDRGDVRILVAPDHITAISTKTHAPGAVPFVCGGAGIERGDSREYHEEAARNTGLLVNPGYKLVRTFLTDPIVSAEALRDLSEQVST
jgi:2,3-bisphosphoglycerate-independent phosphoglycerate mutase